MAGISFRTRADGYLEAEFVDSFGTKRVIQAYNAEVLQSKVEKAIERYGQQKIIKREGTGTRGGRTTNAAKKNSVKLANAFRDVFGEVRAKAVMAGSAAAAVTNAKITSEVASDLLNKVYNAKGKYNTYTGNLERAYMATIVTGRKAKQTVFLDSTPVGNPPRPHEKSGKIIVDIFKERHALGRIRRNKFGRRSVKFNLPKYDRYFNRVGYRYFKGWELRKGYRQHGVASVRGGRMSGFQYLAKGNYIKGTTQSGIIIENAAPYAGAVEAKGYQVIPYGFLKSYNMRNNSRQQNILFVVTKEMLAAAKLI